MDAEPRLGRTSAVIVVAVLLLATANAAFRPVRPADAEITVQLSLNTATAAELELLPGVGPSLAERIVEDRTLRGPFRTIEDLDRVKGVGPSLLEQVSPFVTP